MNTLEVQRHWAEYWGTFHDDGVNTCIVCLRVAYKRWDKRYKGYRGFCTYCGTDWAES